MGADLSKGSFRPLATITSCPIDANSSSWMLQPAVAQVAVTMDVSDDMRAAPS